MIKIMKYCQSTIKETLINTSLKYVHKYSWSNTAIIAACHQLNLSPASHSIIQPYHIISTLMNRWNKASLTTINDTNFGGNKSITHKINYAIKTRLSHQIQYQDIWHHAMSIGAHPNNIIITKDILWDYSDQVWKLCGDQSIDYNYYTKRILFNTAYAATELYLLTDQTNNKHPTWSFLQRALKDIQSIGSSVRNTKIVLESLGNGLLSTVNMLNQPQHVQHPIIKQQQKSNNKVQS